jgi:AmmeMemoRadiSam system protein A
MVVPQKTKVIITVAAIVAVLIFCFFIKENTMGQSGKSEKNKPAVVSNDDAVVTAQEKQFLLKLARQTLEMYLKNGTMPKVDRGQLSERLIAEKGCFVTLDKKDYGLRGCIGYIMPIKPLYQSIMDNAVNAAIHDPRFPQVAYNELPDITIDISVLTVPQDLPFSSPQDLLAKLVPLRDGVILKTQYGSSTFLPQVWGDLPDKEQFLAQLCRKHGAPADEWRKPDVSVQTYRAVVFGEEAAKKK